MVSDDQKLIFSGFILHYDGESNNDSEILYAGISALGGQYRINFEPDITHLVTDRWKQEYAGLIQKGIKILAPEYFDDCFRLGLRCNDSHYLFPNPIIHTHDLLAMMELKSQSRAPSKILENHRTETSIFKTDLFFIDKTSQNDTYLMDKMKVLGLKMCQDLRDSTIAITEVQNETYHEALLNNLELGTARWIADQLHMNVRLHSSTAVLHYPRPRYIIPEFKDLVISITNYTGSAREDICKMALAMGASFTRSLTKENTHLICSAPIGDRYAKARQWNIHILNHLWVEESYSRWSFMTEGNPKYYHFISSLGEIVGKTIYERPATKEFHTIQNNISGKKIDTGVKVLLSGFNDSAAKMVNLSEQLKVIGIHFTTDLHDFDCLVAKRFSKTEKLLIAISKGKPILGLEWLDRCRRQGSVLDFDDFSLSTAALDLTKSVSRARNQPLLAGYVVIISIHVNPGAETLENIVKAGGAEFVTIDSNKTNTDILNSQLLSIQCKSLIAVGNVNDREFKEIVSKIGIKLVSPDSLLNSILEQNL